MGFLVLLVLVALLPMNNAEGYGEEEPCKVVRPGVCVPRDQWVAPPIIPCVNFDVLLEEVAPLVSALPATIAELGFGFILPHLEELMGAGNIEFRGPTAIPSGGVAAPHWTRPGTVTLLIYTVTLGGVERFFAFPSAQFDALAPGDALQGPVQSLQAEITAFPSTYPNTAAESLPFLGEDFGTLLASFEAGGDNEGLTRGTDALTKATVLSVYSNLEESIVRCAAAHWIGFRLAVR
ncbi:Hypp3073 [Branchiostoma lanceolatum]|uniref:Hypp3073 protein n=1 Tax=Branchiostoma lanceolatum TaxID=7740 RepID=A0A8K0A1B5_BRALA|nr:Hypp3073 [Branchiostoma lanceolatum]